MYALLYRWRLVRGAESEFKQAWSDMTVSIRSQCGSFGSRLHRCDDGTWVAYAVWPDRESRQRCMPDNPSAAAVMSTAVLERFEPLRLTVVTDLISGPLTA
ncbi:antibiotic biosynthesis monooxygenase family protein [Jatrophihabitans lederbergiae]|uniref:Antibiotic biosynthesis monooxygenase n=1 Tax=Jatrophihabitans lederbergiae TaxID=3075547 RepID=A0ABU2JFG2_9ACTN|nr:antibiotic biosynthesis monooxygenase [Jatrophihabitans sp. DSM 44399]MDT0263424.1 hypothetical protein [Jatrophihabitans sp. DSM 44399]